MSENLELLDSYNGWEIVASRTKLGARGGFGRWNSRTGIEPHVYARMRDDGNGFTSLKVIRDKLRNRSTELLLWMPAKLPAEENRPLPENRFAGQSQHYGDKTWRQE